MLNKAIITGRLTANPELKTTTSGVNVTQFSLAVQRNFKNSNGDYDTDFINIVAWRKQAEFVSNYFGKGQLITVVGSLQSRSYEDKEGNKRNILEVVAEEVLFAESKKSEGTPKDFSVGQGGNDMAFEEITDDECPF